MARGRLAPAGRTIAARAHSRQGRRTTTCLNSLRSTRPVDVPAVGQSPPATRAAVMAAMAGTHPRESGLLGSFQASRAVNRQRHLPFGSTRIASLTGRSPVTSDG